MEYEAVILAGGFSARMGSSKVFLPFNKENTFLGHLLLTYGACRIPVHVVVNKEIQEKVDLFIQDKRYKYLKIHIFVNPDADKGKYSSIAMGLKYITEGSAVFLQNIDNPFVNPALLRKMMRRIKRGPMYVVPAVNGKKGHPVLLSPELVSKLRSEIKADFHLRHFLTSFLYSVVEWEDEKVLANINRKDEYDRYFSSEKKAHKT